MEEMMEMEMTPTPESDTAADVKAEAPVEEVVAEETALLDPDTDDLGEKAEIANGGEVSVDGTIDLNLFVSSDKKINTRILSLTGKAFAGVIGEFDPYVIDLDAIEMSPEGASVEAVTWDAEYNEQYPLPSQPITELSDEIISNGIQTVDSTFPDPDSAGTEVLAVSDPLFIFEQADF